MAKHEARLPSIRREASKYAELPLSTSRSAKGSMRPCVLLPRSAIDSLPKCHRFLRKPLIQNGFLNMEHRGCSVTEGTQRYWGPPNSLAQRRKPRLLGSFVDDFIVRKPKDSSPNSQAWQKETWRFCILFGVSNDTQSAPLSVYGGYAYCTVLLERIHACLKLDFARCPV